MKEKNRFHRRLTGIMYFVCFLFLCIALRLCQVQLTKTSMYRSRVLNQIEANDEEIGERGNILDREGKQLAFNKRQYTVIIDPSKIHINNDQFLKNLQSIAEKGVLPLDATFFSRLEKDFQANKKYKVIAKKIDDVTKDQIKECLSKIPDERRYLFFKKEIERETYRKDIYDTLIGMVRFTSESKDKKSGVFGLEKKYEHYLVGKTLIRNKFYSRDKKKVLPTSAEWMYTNLNGNNLYLSIDNEVNYILNDEVKTQFDETQAEEAYGVIMDPRDGSILGISTYTRHNKDLRNQIFQNQYEPGSIFKPIVVAAALDEGLIKKNSHFDIGNGSIVKYRHTIHESSRSTRGVLSTTDVIKKSSNVGMVLIGDHFTEEQFENSLRKFGLYEKTGVDFPDEIKPYTTPYKKWDKLKKSNMAFGQGITVTPIQMITAFSSLVNGGKLYRPHLVEKIVDDDGIVVYRNVPRVIRQVVKPEVSEMMKEMLEETVANGTGSKAKVEGYRVGGKTGTAQLSSNGRYLANQYLSSFVGFFPVEDPQYVILVMLLKPQSESMFGRYGGAVSAPVVGNIIRRISKIKNVSSQETPKILTSDTPDLSANHVTSLGEEMPELKGLSSKQVLQLFQNKEYDIEIYGTGLVTKQNPEAGTSLEKVRKIEVTLE